MEKNKSFLSRIIYLSKNRFVLFILLMAGFVLFTRWQTGSWLPSADTKDFWFYSGLFMVLFSIFFIEPYYTSPKNVVTNVMPLIFVFLSIKSSFSNELYWWITMSVFIVLVMLSIIAMSLENKNFSDDHLNNRVSRYIKKIVVFIGDGKKLYSAIFFYFLLTYYSIQDFYTIFLFLFWAVILLIDPQKIHNDFIPFIVKESKNQIGEIFGVQSKKIFLVKLFENKTTVQRFDIVKFHYSMQASDELYIGIIFDTYFLNQEKWAKVLQISKPQKKSELHERNIVYKVTDKVELNKLSKEIRVDDFIGIVGEDSTIGKIKFEYSMKNDSIKEGDLVELFIGDEKIFYQIIIGITEKERLEAKNETGFIEGEAIQLGVWDSDKLSFQKYGWVPSINTPIFTANTTDITFPEINYPMYSLGVIPGTNLPFVIDLDDAISHHLALLGITGSGKSYLARQLIDQLITDTKIICVDFNKEFITEITPSPRNIINDSIATQISSDIDWINIELGEFSNRQDHAEIERRKVSIKDLLKNEINSFINDKNNNICVFELPDVSNTTGIFDYTKNFFRVLFEVAKERQLLGNVPKLCVILEEAHTVIPEWNFSGSFDKTSQSLVNSIGQIALQGRKYGIGFVVIAQRTANVSKTVLTQCNTVVCFQAFDKTSFDFLSNYIGTEIVQTLPDLKQYHAVVAGKAIKSNMPMIVDLTR